MSKYTIDSIGLGALLSQRRFGVPTYQRSYAWGSGEGRDEVEDFWNDLQEAVDTSIAESYFLGTVVLSDSAESSGSSNSPTGRSYIIDGQQRLTTAFLLLLAIRDIFIEFGDERHKDVELKYIASRDLRTMDIEPRLLLGSTDNEFLQVHLIRSEAYSLDRRAPQSHRLLAKGFEYLKARIREQAIEAGDGWAAKLVDWVDFLHERALVITVTVPTESDAFLIFETLNDRGIDLTIADLTKNYIFSRSGKRLSEANERWISASAYIEQATGTGSKFTDFLRYYFTSQQGPTREREIFDRVKERKLLSATDAVAFAEELKKAAQAYSRLLGADPTYWPSVQSSAAENVEALRILEVERLRPVLLAAMLRFSNAELGRLLKGAVAAAVRMRISRTAEGSVAERVVANVAQAISSREVKTARDALDQLSAILPSDEQFRNDFSSAIVRRPSYARYYLRSLEIQERSPGKVPEFVANSNAGEVNLEHILPQNAVPEWNASIPRDRQPEYTYRLGNQVLLRASENRTQGNLPFGEKRASLASSSLALTQITGGVDDWTMEQVDLRQRRLADLAVLHWKVS